MTVKDIAEKIGAEIICEGEDMSRNVNGCYVGDLLSWVMSKAQQDNIWITIMSNVNVVAVATLTDVSCVLMCENVMPDDECLLKAKQQGVTLLGTKLTAFEVALKIGEIV